MAFSPARATPLRPVLAGAVAPVGRELAALRVTARVEIALVIAAVLLAGIIRWPNLLLSPQFSSGGSAIPMALDIADGRAFYLREVSPYIGTPYIWLLAVVYRIFGPSVEATMLVTWLTGTLTIMPTYLLGRQLAGRLVGGIAALLLATSSAHTVISSHVPISHSLTPLIATTILWLVALAVQRANVTPLHGRGLHGGRLLALAGFLTGVALQTHPTIAPLLMSAGLGALLVHRGWLRTRWPVIALALVVVGYGPLLVYHLTSGFEIITDIQTKQGRYRDVGRGAGGAPLSQVYPENLGQLGLSTMRLLSGDIDERDDVSDYLGDPWVLAPAGLAVAGLIVAARRQAWWLVAAVTVAIFVPPAFSGKYRPVLDGRFLMPLIPVLFVMVGVAVAAAARKVLASRADLSDRADAAGWPWRAAQGVALGVLILGPTLMAARSVTLLDSFYENSIEDGISNAVFLSTAADLQAARVGDEAVLLDPQLDQVKSVGGGKANTSLTWILAVSRIPSEALDDTADPRILDGRLAILQRATADRLDDTVQLVPLDGRRQIGKDRPSYRAYRIGGATAPK
jgi:4-amino-4-deoxy-L-arabinose transferase-like glycosyltransferase